MTIIYKVVPASVWQAAEASGVFQGSGIDLQDGYIHFSAPDQVVETVALYFAAQNDLMLVGVDSDALGDALRWERSRDGALFPHLYGELALSAVVHVHPLPLGTDGVHQFPRELSL